jgi:hypothetical protein
LLQFLHNYRTLQKFYACLRSQQEVGRIKRFFRQVDITFQLNACQAELSTALEDFKVGVNILRRGCEFIQGFQMKSVAAVSGQVATMEIDLEQRHQELMDIIGGRQSIEFSDTASPVWINQWFIVLKLTS